MKAIRFNASIPRYLMFKNKSRHQMIKAVFEFEKK